MYPHAALALTPVGLQCSHSILAWLQVAVHKYAAGQEAGTEHGAGAHRLGGAQAGDRLRERAPLLLHSCSLFTPDSSLVYAGAPALT